MSKNTLFGYFKKVESPSGKKTVENEEPMEQSELEPVTPKSGALKARNTLISPKSKTPKNGSLKNGTPNNNGSKVTPKRVGIKNTPSSTSSRTPSSTPSRTPSRTPSKTPSRTPSRTPSKTPSSTQKGRKSVTAVVSSKKTAGTKRKPLDAENGAKQRPLKRVRLEEEEEGGGEEVEKNDDDDDADEQKDWVDDIPSSEEEDVSSEDDYKPNKDESDVEESDLDDLVSENDPSSPSEDDASEIDSPIKKTPRRAGKSSSRAPATPKTPSASLAQSVSRNPSEWQHVNYEFLRQPKDLSRKSQDDPDYDPSTLFVPSDFMNNLTPGVRQWWELKSRHFDTVLFFKVGKFYELYHMDAVIGVENLGLTYMKGDWAHSGFPEVALQRNMEALIQKGYKCARVEQTETPAMMEQRCKLSGKSTKFDKVVRREICNISSKGLQLCGADVAPGSAYLLSFLNKERRFGVCLLDSTVGRFHIGEFEDDHQLSSLRTLVSRFAPVEVIMERNVSADLRRIVETIGAIVHQPARNQFLSGEKALTLIREREFFKNNEYPSSLKKLIADNDPLMSTPKPGYELAVGAFATIVGRLEQALILEDVLTMGEFEPVEFKFDSGRDEYLPKIMIMDSVALTNLEIFQNSVGTSEGSLLSTINFCSTPFGLRQLKKWLLGPSCIAEEIESRWDAVGELMDSFSLLKSAQERLKKLPDMDKMLARIHSLSLKKSDHPDSRAILYNNDVYSKRKIEDFCNVLDGFRDAILICKMFKDKDLKSLLLKALTQSTSDGGRFPDLNDALSFFDKAFDKAKALKDGKIVPAAGVDKEFDEARHKIAEIKESLDDHLRKQAKHFGAKVTYVGAGRTAYQIEVPEGVSAKATEEHTLQGNRKGFKRYYTVRGRALCDEMLLAEEKRDSVSKDLMRRIFHSFDEKRPLWKKAIECLGILDCLMSLALYGNNAGGSVCRPKINQDAQKAMLRVVNGSHPCLLRKLGQDKLIANDFSLGIVDEGHCDGSSVALLTGPNMGGKSTLMRQVGLLVVMAQLGAWVPAEEMEFSLVDRVFTRLGAADHITLGESTFLVEMLETSAVFKHATKSSLVLLDELGRGTSTNDGASLAYAVLAELAKSNRRTLFSTHYHDLAKDIGGGVYLGHMACVVENDEDVVFLYKFVAGHCEKSFGFNVASLAGLPQKIVSMGLQRAKELENQSELLQKFVKFMSI